MSSASEEFLEKNKGEEPIFQKINFIFLKHYNFNQLIHYNKIVTFELCLELLIFAPAANSEAYGK